WLAMGSAPKNSLALNTIRGCNSARCKKWCDAAIRAKTLCWSPNPNFWACSMKTGPKPPRCSNAIFTLFMPPDDRRHKQGDVRGDFYLISGEYGQLPAYDWPRAFVFVTFGSHLQVTGQPVRATVKRFARAVIHSRCSLVHLLFSHTRTAGARCL